MNHEAIIAQRMSIIPLSLYIHFPWCLNKCPYCDFNSSKLPNREIIPGYVDRLLFDIEMEIINNLNLRMHAGRHSRKPLVGIQKKPELKSIYFGGGTPSLLSPEQVSKIIEFVKKYFDFAEDIEISLEANSKTVDLNLCKGFKEAGINRFSVGVQSFNDTQLKKIQRIHNAKQALETVETVETVKLAGFDNFNIDLMFGLPNQEIKDAILDLETALNFSPNHLSWYQLTLEDETLFDDLPQSEDMWNMQKAGEEVLQKFGLKQYEVSAFSKSLTDRCKHHINYWQYGDYIGIGAGAHGKLTFANYLIKRYEKISDPIKYIESENLVKEEEIINKEKVPLEFMMNALRLHQPISYDLFQKRTGFIIDVIYEKLQLAKQLGLIELQDDSIIVTNHGRNFLNDLLEIFL